MKPKRMPPYVNVSALSEDQRIDVIGHNVMHLGKVVGFLVEDEAGKAERYIAKLKEKFPGIQVLGQAPVLGKEVVAVRVGPPTKQK